MAHFVNDSLPAGAAVQLPGEFLAKLHALLEPIHAHAVASLEDRAIPALPALPALPAPAAVLSDDQFAELKALLAPGHELAQLLLEDRRARVAALPEPAKASHPKEAEAALHRVNSDSAGQGSAQTAIAERSESERGSG